MMKKMKKNTGNEIKKKMTTVYLSSKPYVVFLPMLWCTIILHMCKKSLDILQCARKLN